MGAGDFQTGSTVYILFTTRAFATGIPTVLAGTPVVSAYEDDSVTQITAGITLGVDHDGVVGMNLLTIVATGGNGYEAGKAYSLVITTGTVDGVSVVGEVVGHFTLDASSAAAVLDKAIEDHDTQGTIGWAMALAVYNGPHGVGIYIDDGAANTSTVVGTDGTSINPVSTLGAARTIADAIGVRVYYFTGSDLTLAATHEDWLFVGLGEVTANVINLGSQDVDRSRFMNVCVEGTQGGSERIQVIECALRDPGPGSTTLHVFAQRSGIVDRIQVDTSEDNVFDSCYSLVAGTDAPIIQATGASGTIAVRHFSGGIEFESLSASHNVSVETDGQVIFDSSCNVNAKVVLRGNMTIEDNTAGMNSLTVEAVFNRAAVNTEMVDVLFTDAISELAQAIPSATPSISAALMAIYMALRNKLDITSSLMEIHNDAGTVIIKKALTDDGSVYSEAEAVSGP